jgi:hypothetical protein
MKKIFLSIITFTIVFSSCSSNDNEQLLVNEDSKLLEKIEYIEITNLPSGLWNADLTNIYNGNKLIRATRGNITAEIKIKNNKLIHSSFIADNKLFEYKYIYSGDDLIEFSEYADGTVNNKIEYSYDGIGLKSIKNTTFYSGTPESSILDVEYNQNTVKFTFRENPNSFYICTYDDKKHQDSGAIYMLPLLRSQGNNNYNNIIKHEHSHGQIFINNNEYDDDDYIKRTVVTDNKTPYEYSINYFYKQQQ